MKRPAAIAPSVPLRRLGPLPSEAADPPLQPEAAESCSTSTASGSCEAADRPLQQSSGTSRWPPGQLPPDGDVQAMIPRQRFQKVGRPISFAVDPVPDFLDKVINERLHGAEVQALAGWVAASKSCSIGSVCAGTDCPVDVSRQVLEAVSRSTGVPMPKFEHASPSRTTA